MVAWADYKAEAKTRGALAFELYVAHSTPAKAPEDVKASLPDHLAYQAKLEREGKLAFAGPMSDETGEHMQGMGLIIYRADSLEAARALAEADPMHGSGARTYILRRWMINEGSVSVSANLSTGGATLS
ncbi:YciI family protein [Aliiroseovarius subalbicans]|uniref:YciI family protein n=1 Tax=Aliiroseovarius subalbicans TaxID=2925840 RepID=UPI001F55EE99|nr:YciI family protein [Aliiroseovarius subalbicans]MCI2400501.1 YciI family protein [Aliiroseovarius subalbicans]